ncbi:paralemmin-1-like isoform X1 [Acipenser oxyrinchus oxyrinchus]|uniref:Paralemmin-1 n=1 Tax=Acipenser oxyrinchus oxyrinchus TaxID=40147 RepID=A0AAD8FV98_ACIOX|nr:paralemmin-1-like isoform X1 [Acipenser oxyrinchus oxyrinchus]
MEMSDTLIQQERLQAIAEKRKRQAEIENKRRQLEDERRQLQHLKSKALRERWLLDGAPSAASEEDEAMKKQLQEDEAKTKGLEETIQSLEQELEELETGVSATSTKESLSEAANEESGQTGDHTEKTPSGSVKEVRVHSSPRLDKSGGDSDLMRAAMYSVEITIEKDRVTGETKVLSTNTLLPKNLAHQGVKVYEDDLKVVHAVRAGDGAIENGVHLLSSTEVEELIHKADEVTMSDTSASKDGEGTPKSTTQTPKKEITGIEAKPTASPQTTGNPSCDASLEHPVTMVFMGYQNVEDEAETNKVLGLEGTVKAELVVIEDGNGKGGAEEGKEGKEGQEEQQQAPPNGSTAEPPKNQEGGEKGEAEPGAGEVNTKEKQPCKCCAVM